MWVVCESLRAPCLYSAWTAGSPSPRSLSGCRQHGQAHTAHPGMSVAFGLPETCQWLPTKAYRLADKLQNFVNSNYLNRYSKAAKDMARFICQIQISSWGIGKKRKETKWWAYLFLLSWYACLQVFWKCKEFSQCLKHELVFNKPFTPLWTAMWSKIPYI